VKPDTIINMIANGVLTAGVSCFMILLYRTEGVTQRWPIVGNAFLRLSLTATAAGALFNCRCRRAVQLPDRIHAAAV